MNMREIQKMQQRLIKLQEELESSQFTGTAGGGAVTITMSGKLKSLRSRSTQKPLMRKTSPSWK